MIRMKKSIFLLIQLLCIGATNIEERFNQLNTRISTLENDVKHLKVSQNFLTAFLLCEVHYLKTIKLKH